jgi:drug/metabolite transporter (DMT)-like permease
MKTWREALRDGMLSGSVASLVSTVVLSQRGERENGTPYAPTNAISHWIWGERAARRDGPSARYTAVGYAIHHASSTLWAVIYEKWFGDRAERGEIVPALASGAAVAALACFVDYNLTPRRLQPGFEKRLSTPSLFFVYATFGAGLVLRGLTASHAQHSAHAIASGIRR